MANPPSRLKNIRCVVRDDIDAIQLCQTLGGHGDEDTSTISTEHVSVSSLTLLPLKQNIHLDITEFFAGFGVVDVTLAVKVGNDDDAFFVTIGI